MPWLELPPNPIRSSDVASHAAGATTAHGRNVGGPGAMNFTFYAQKVEIFHTSSLHHLWPYLQTLVNFKPQARLECLYPSKHKSDSRGRPQFTCNCQYHFWDSRHITYVNQLKCTNSVLFSFSFLSSLLNALSAHFDAELHTAANRSSDLWAPHSSHTKVDAHLLVCTCARSCRFSSNLRIEKSARKKLTFVVLRYIPATLTHLFCAI